MCAWCVHKGACARAVMCVYDVSGQFWRFGPPFPPFCGFHGLNSCPQGYSQIFKSTHLPGKNAIFSAWIPDRSKIEFTNPLPDAPIASYAVQICLWVDLFCFPYCLSPNAPRAEPQLFSLCIYLSPIGKWLMNSHLGKHTHTDGR